MALNRPLWYVGVAFNADPFDSGATPSYTDLTSRFLVIGQASRGRQYELDQNQAGQSSISWLNIDEALNPVNTGSPYSPNVLPYRQVVEMAQWPAAPVGGAVNLINVANPDTIDGTFESYAIGSTPAGIIATGGGVNPAITATTPFQGTRCLGYAASATGSTQGVGITIPTMPGKQYTASWYVRQSAANTIQIFINGGAAGTSTSTAGAYVRLTVTFTASQPQHQLFVASFGTALAGFVFVDAVQVEPGAAANTFSATGPMLRPLWRGYVERWPTAWDSMGYEGQSTTPAVGPFAILQNGDLRTEYSQCVMAKKPDYYWRLNEPAGSTMFAESSGNNGPPLLKTISPLGAGANTVFTPGTATNVAGEPGQPGLRMAPTAGDEGQLNKPFQFLQLGYAAGSTRLTGAQTASGVTGQWSQSMAFITTRPATMVSGSGLIRFVDPITNTSACSWLGGAGSFTVNAINTVTDSWGDGKPHLYVTVVTLTTAAGGTLTSTAYVDGVQVATTTLTGMGAQPRPNMALSVGAGEVTYTFNRAWQDHTPQDIAYWNRALSAFEIADLNNAFQGYPGENSGARISRYLSIGGYLGPTSIQTGSSNLGVSALAEGTSILAACQAAAGSEFGNFFEGGAYLSFASRFSRYLATTSSVTFGDNPAGGEYPYLGDINFDFDPNLIYNIADVTQSGGIVGHAEDTTGVSQKRYGKKNFTRTVQLQSANEVIDAATWTVNNRKAPGNRVAAITLNPAATVGLPFGDGTMWSMIIGLEIGQRVTVIRRPKAANGGAGITMTGDYFIESINHHDINPEAGTFLTTLLLSPVSLAQPWILENATYGKLDFTTVLGF